MPTPIEELRTGVEYVAAELRTIHEAAEGRAPVERPDGVGHLVFERGVDLGLGVHGKLLRSCGTSRPGARSSG